MKKILLLSGTLVALTATAAFSAGLDLGWNMCPTFGGTQNIAFDCVGDVSPSLYGIFQVPVVIDSVVAMDWVMDVSVEAPSLPTFWQMEATDCNNGGFGLGLLKPASGCGTGVTCVATWGTAATGSLSGQGYLDAGRPTVPAGPNRARFLCTIARPATAPIRLNNTSKYYGFSMLFILDNAIENTIGTCVGCTDAACVVWNWTRIGTTTRDPYYLEGPGLVGNAAGVNGGTSSCLATPVRKKTWGQIKALYR